MTPRPPVFARPVLSGVLGSGRLTGAVLGAQAWYWWNNLMQTTWDDPVAGEPRIVPSRLVNQPVKGAASTTQGVTQEQVDALPHVHSRLGDLNMLSLKALRNICTTRDLATRGRRVDLVCRLIAYDVAQ